MCYDFKALQFTVSLKLVELLKTFCMKQLPTL